MKTILISGCLGTVGVFTINRLLLDYPNLRIIGFDNLSGSTRDRVNIIKDLALNIGAEDRCDFFIPNTDNISTMDVSDCLEAIFSEFKIDYILHLASKISVNESNNQILSYFDSNTRLTVELVEYAKKHSIEKFVYASSGSVYGEMPYNKNILGEDDTCKPISLYGVTKYTSEQFIQSILDNSVPYIILRYSNIIAKIDYCTNGYKPIVATVVDKLLNNEKILLYNNGLNTRNFASVETIVNANINAMFIPHTNKIYNIHDNGNITIVDLVYNVIRPCILSYDNIKIDMNSIELTPKCLLGDIKIANTDINLALADNIINYEEYSNNSLNKIVDDYIKWRCNRMALNI